jgi:hypothetical protein
MCSVKRRWTSTLFVHEIHISRIGGFRVCKTLDLPSQHRSPPFYMLRDWYSCRRLVVRLIYWGNRIGHSSRAMTRTKKKERSLGWIEHIWRALIKVRGSESNNWGHSGSILRSFDLHQYKLRNENRSNRREQTRNFIWTLERIGGVGYMMFVVEGTRVTSGGVLGVLKRDRDRVFPVKCVQFLAWWFQ